MDEWLKVVQSATAAVRCAHVGGCLHGRERGLGCLGTHVGGAPLRLWECCVGSRVAGAQTDLVVVDMLVLLMLYAAPPLRKRIESLMRKKIAAGLLPRSLLTNAVRGHATALHEYGPDQRTSSESPA